MSGRAGRGDSRAGRVAGGLMGDGGSSSADGDAWVLTGEVYWNPTGTTTGTRKAAASGQGQGNAALPDEIEARRRCVTEIEEDNVLLLRKISELELQLQKVKSEKKKMEKKHKEELKIRDRKEMVILLVVAGCVLLYAIVAMITRGFV